MTNTNRRNIFIGLGTAALALAVAVPVAFSHGPGPDGEREGFHQKRMERMAEKLGLNEQQQTALEALKVQQRADRQSLREQIRQQRDAMRKLLESPDVSKQQVLAAQREIHALRGQLAESRVDFLFEAKKVLTQDQFKKLLELHQRHGFKGHHRGKRGWGKGHQRWRSQDDAAPETPDGEY